MRAGSRTRRALSLTALIRLVLLVAVFVAAIHTPHVVDVQAAEHIQQGDHTGWSAPGSDPVSADYHNPSDGVSCHMLDILIPKAGQDVGKVADAPLLDSLFSTSTFELYCEPAVIDLPRPQGPSRQALLQRFII